jgi:N6-L-threonylcarbamoyladenine synthase
VSIKVLGLESSCDDTAAAIVDSKPSILSNIIITQYKEHHPFQGVVPEIAARSHLTNMKQALDECIQSANVSINNIDAVAATSGPGLISGIIVGSTYGKAIASVLNKPFIAINHLEGHALIAQLTDNIKFPYLLFLASGGHCQFLAVKNITQYILLGQTLDDAIGEAFDKIAKMMNLGFPGGPIIENLAKNGDPKRFHFPRPLLHKKNCNMSFSGLKTAVRVQIQNMNKLNIQDVYDVSASFQEAVCDVIIAKTQWAIKQYQQHCKGSNTIVVSGGVASNVQIRTSLKYIANVYKYKFIAPPITLCTDNAAMIAFAGLLRFKKGIINGMDFKPRARWSLEELK